MFGRAFRNGERFVNRDEKRHVVLSNNAKGGEHYWLADAKMADLKLDTSVVKRGDTHV